MPPASTHAPPHSPDILHRCSRLIQEGRFAELEEAARRLVGEQPASGVGWKILAVALWQQGKGAVEALEKAAALLPDDAEAHCNLGNALRRQGRVADAVASHTRALAIDPRYAEAHNDLGAAWRDSGQIQEAIACYRQAIALKPDLAVASINLGVALLEIGSPEEATGSFRRALAINPALAAAHAGLGTALMRQGLPEEALGSYQRALDLEPDSAEAHYNLGNALVELGHAERARAHYEMAVAVRPDFAMAHSNLGSALRDLGRADAAVQSFQRALQLRPDLAEVHHNLSIVLRLLHRYDESAASAERAHEMNPSAAAPLITLARLKADHGHFAQAEDLLRRALALDRDSAEACSAIPGLRKMTPDDAHWLADARRIAAGKLPPRQQAHLHYAMGKHFDDIGDFTQAFTHYRHANELKKRVVAGYDREQVHRRISQIMEYFTRDWATRPRHDSVTSSRPVFLVGMPRSGTSLAEQILASHPAIFGAGELSYWSQALADSSIEGQLCSGQDQQLRSLAVGYLEVIGTRAAGAARVIDKMPANFLALGLIHAALPNARILHMRRHPIDTCLSIYFQDFDATYAYANDLEDLAHYYGEYSRLMDHWQSVLPADAVMTVAYEELVSDPASWSRKMVEFLGVAWDPICLEFHQTSRTVITESRWQVRQKISNRSVERWRHYERHLGPLLRLNRDRAADS